MILLDIFEQREPHQLAIDALEQRYIEQIKEKIDVFKKSLAKATDNEMRVAIKKRIQELEQELVKIHSVQREAEQPQQTPAKGLLKNKDLITPQQRLAGATPPQTSMLGKAKQTLGSFADWLAGKDDVGPTYENDLNETDENSLINRAKYVWEQIRRAHDGNVDTATIRWMGNSEPITMSRNQLYHAVQKIKAMSRQNRNAFATQTLADRNNFSLWLGSQKKITPRPPLKQPSDPFQPELPLGKPKISPVQERTQKKKSDDIQAGDVKVARELQKLRAQYPAARSDVEAVARAEIDSSERSNQQIAAIRGANEKQDSLLKQLVALDQEQGREIDNLDSENNNLEKQLAKVQATNNRLQQTIGQMTGTKKSTRAKVAPTVATSTTSAQVDANTVKKIQDLESQIQSLQARPSTPDIEKKIDNLQSRINALPAQAAQALNIDQNKQSTTQVPRPKAPAGDLDINPAEKQTTKAKTTKAKTTKAKTSKPAPTVATTDDDLNVLDIDEPDMFAVKEHGGGIGPRQHWQDLMREGEMKDIDIMRQYLKLMSDLQFMRAHGMSKVAFTQKYRTLLKPASQQDVPMEGTAQQFGQAIRMAGYTGRELEKDPAYKKSVQHARQEREQSQHNIERVKHGYGEEPDEYHDIDETFAMPGTTVPLKSVIQGYTVFYNPKTQVVSVTRGGDSEEAAIEQARLGTPNIKNFRQAAERLIDKIENEDQLINEGVKDMASATAVIACLLTGGSLTGCATAPQQTSAQQVLKTGQDIGRTVQTAQRITKAGVEAEVNQEIRNLLRGVGGRPEELNHSNILRIWKKIKGAPTQPEPQNEAKEILTRQDFIKERDRLLRMISVETESANKQILRAAIRQLENQAENQGWINVQQRMIREDNASKAAEQAILKRIFVAHRDLLMNYGPQKVMQAAEEVAYNVGDVGEIGTSDVSGWVNQVKQILGATA